VRVIEREREKTEKDAISITERRDKKKKREKKHRDGVAG